MIPRPLRRFLRTLRAPLRPPLYGLYERRLAKRLQPQRLPSHVAIMLDGNRRWAREQGAALSEGWKAGGDNVIPFVQWCDELGIQVVTLWLLSTDNLSRPSSELEPLLMIIEEVVQGLADVGRWKINIVGNLELLPPETRDVLTSAERQCAAATGTIVNVAVGYGGRQEIADAVRALLNEAEREGKTLADVAASVDVHSIARHLYTSGIPDPDLVIRTSGEIRVGGFLLWQSTHSELYFCEAYWPDFRRVDFLRALRDYGMRQRRFGA